MSRIRPSARASGPFGARRFTLFPVLVGAVLGGSLTATAAAAGDLTVPSRKAGAVVQPVRVARGIPPQWRRVQKVSLFGVSAVNINGEILLASVQATNATASGTVTVDKPLASSVAGSAAVNTPALDVAKPLDAAIAATATATATPPTVEKPLAATATVAGAVVASLEGSAALLVSSVSGTATATATTVTVPKPLDAAVTTTAVTGSTLTSADGPLPPVARGLWMPLRNRMDPRRRQTGGPLWVGGLDTNTTGAGFTAGVTTTVTVGSAALTVPKPLAASAAVTSEASGNMAGAAAALAATTTATGALAGLVTVAKPLAASVSMSGTVTGAVGGASALLTATATGSSSGAGTLTVAKPLAADIAAVVYLDGIFEGDTPGQGRLHRRSLYFFR